MPLNEKMTEIPHVYVGFNHTAEALPKTDFVDYLQKKFKDKATTSAVLDAFEKMGQPAPEDKNEFMDGTEGALVFLNRFGLVLRIEQNSDFVKSPVPTDRIDYSPFILKPIASIKVGKAIFEICPGCLLDTDEEKSKFLYKQLKEQSIEFFDNQVSNSGRVPVHTPLFPEGIPVVIDRGAVRELTGSLSYVRALLGIFKSKNFREAAAAQEELYTPLRDSFDAAWPDKSELPDTLKMKRFWNLCEGYTKDEKLTAGWKDAICTVDSYYKQGEAQKTAAIYGLRLESLEQTITPASAAVYPLTSVPA